jgi:sugar phosphate isomerase/epimerase
MRFAICNETFEGWDHERICRLISGLGYKGLELAPYTLAPRITDITSDRRRLLRKQAEERGVSIVGLHWLLARTEGLQLTATEQAVRSRTAQYLIHLASCCRDLGGNVLVFGSPAQRLIPEGATAKEAAGLAADTFCRALPAIADCGVTLCLEPLASSETDFINTCAQAMDLIEKIDHPNFKLHLDVKAMASEDKPVTELIRVYGGRAGHFHANDANRRGPGFGDVDYVPIFQALRESGYRGWVSVEVFDYTPDPETIARQSIAYMRRCAIQASA